MIGLNIKLGEPLKDKTLAFEEYEPAFEIVEVKHHSIDHCSPRYYN